MRRAAAEFLGTFMLLFIGTGAIIANDATGGSVGHVGICLAFGLTVMTVIYAVGDVSGAHLNPAVTIGFWASGRFAFREVPVFVAAQVLGALTASGLLRVIFTHETYGATLPTIDASGAFIIEAILTWFLMFVILGVSDGSKEKGLMAGVAVGGVITLEAIFGGPFTGGSMNPARSLAPAIVSGQFSGLWIYLMAPVIGSLLAVPACRLVRGDTCCGDDGECAA